MTSPAHPPPHTDSAQHRGIEIVRRCLDVVEPVLLRHIQGKIYGNLDHHVARVSNDLRCWFRSRFMFCIYAVDLGVPPGMIFADTAGGIIAHLTRRIDTIWFTMHTNAARFIPGNTVNMRATDIEIFDLKTRIAGVRRMVHAGLSHDEIHEILQGRRALLLGLHGETFGGVDLPSVWTTADPTSRRSRKARRRSAPPPPTAPLP